MLRGMYVAATGMFVQRRRMDVLTNNITNIETSGFKKDTLLTRSFEDVMLERLNDPNVVSAYSLNSQYGSQVGNYNYGVHIDELVTSFLQGAMEQTERQEDFALTGEGFFVVNTPEGERYTRAGNFYATPTGALVTAEGYPVMGTNGAINVGTGSFSVDEAGNIFVNNNFVNSFRKVNFADVNALRKQGDNLYYNYGNSAMTGSDAVIKQGYLENSNVDAGESMVEMMEISRIYESNQRMLRMIDDTLGRAVNDIARM